MLLVGRQNSTDLNILHTEDSSELLEEALEVRDMLPIMYREIERKKAKFWKMFKDQYLESLRFQNKATRSRPGLLPSPGDIVIIWSKNDKLLWKKGLVTELVTSLDGLVRSAYVKVNNKVVLRSLKHLYPLELKAEQNVQNYINNKQNRQNDFKGFKSDQQNKNKSRIEALYKEIHKRLPGTATVTESDPEDD